MQPVELSQTIVSLPFGARITYYWPAGEPTTKPFWVTYSIAKAWQANPRYAPFPYRAIWDDPARAAVWAVRTDEYPLWWLGWWLRIRLQESWILTARWLFYLLQIWGLAYCEPYKLPTIKDLFRRRHDD